MSGTNVEAVSSRRTERIGCGVLPYVWYSHGDFGGRKEKGNKIRRKRGEMRGRPDLSLMAPKLVAALDRLDSPVDSFDRSGEAADPSA